MNKKYKMIIKCTKKKAERGTAPFKNAADSKQKQGFSQRALDCRFCGTHAIDSITIVICQIKRSQTMIDLFG